MTDKIKAQIFKSAKREFECKLTSSGEMITACALGNLLKHEETLVVGDYVDVIFDTKSKEYVIHDVYPRNNEIYRLLVRESKKKVTAANCDNLVILNSVSRPEFKRGFVDRFLIRACQWAVKPIVVFNKMDEYDPEIFDMCFEEARLKNLKVECFEIQATNPKYKPRFLKKGLEDLKEILEHKTSLFVGQSGVGKSKTIEALSNGKFELKTQNIGKVGKGIHTTTWSEIIEFNNYTLIDSPGIRSFSLDDIPEEDILLYCPDIAEIACRCKFSNCTHTPTSKGCAFYSEFPLDSYEGKLIFSRLHSYLRIVEEIAQTPNWKKIK